MHLFKQEIVEILNLHCTENEIHFVGLGRWDFQLSFGHAHISNELKVSFAITGKEYIWEQEPIDIPAWILVGQIPERFQLNDMNTLVMYLKSGDSLSFYTEESRYECCVIDFLKEDNTKTTEVF